MSKHKLDEMMAKSAARMKSQERAQPLAATTPTAPALEGADRDTRWIERDLIEANPDQPRIHFPEETLRELGESLRKDGQLQALLVRPHPLKTGRFQLVSGERRWRAAGPKYGDIERLRCTIRDLTDGQVLRLSLIENVQRADLTAIEKARGLARLRDAPRDGSPRGEKLTLEELAQEVSFQKSQVQRLLSLLDLPKSTQKAFDELDLNEKHGRALLMLEGRAQSNLLGEIREENLSGNEALRRAELLRKPPQPETPAVATGPSTGTSSAPVSRETGASSTPSATPVGDLQDGTGFHQNTPAPATTAPSRPDVLNEQLRPALAFLAEARRRIGDISASPDYRRDILTLAARIEEEARRLREDMG